MVASRYLWPVAILLSLALVPTIIHSYLQLSENNSPAIRTIKPDLGEFISIPTRKHADWGKETFGCTDWFERQYKNRQGDTARLFVGRAYDHKRLYHHPELALSHGEDLRSAGIVVLSGHPPMPVHMLRHNTQPKIAAYALYYDGYFIADPISHQLKNSINLLFSPERPMTLFYVSEDNLDNQQDFNKTLSAKVLVAAIDSFLGKSQVP
jgi:hypothetical protein